MNETLTPAEMIIMQCLWESGEDLTVYEIMERLKTKYGKDYTQNAVSTFMNILRKKGIVSRYKKHHSHQYHPEINMDEFRNGQLKDFSDQWYHGSAVDVLASLVEVSHISTDELIRMKELLNEYSNKC